MADALCSREPQTSVYNELWNENRESKERCICNQVILHVLSLIKNTKKLKLLKKENYYKFLSDDCFNVLRRTSSSSFVLVSYS